MIVQFQVVSEYEIEYPYAGGTETADADFAAAMKEIENDPDAVVARAKRLRSKSGWITEA